MATSKVPGTRLRALRETRSMSQAALARTLGISPSYLNQIEHGSRPLTVPVLLRITEVFGVDAAFFAARQPERLVAELHEVFSETSTADGPVPPSEVERLAAELPAAADAVLELYRHWRRSEERLAHLSSGSRDGVAAPPRSASPHEQVRDFFYRRRNHVAELDDAAEDLAHRIGVRRGEVRRALAERLRAVHGVTIAGLDDEGGSGELHRYDATHRVLRLSPALRPGQQAFRMATQLAFLEFDDVIEALAGEQADPDDVQTHRLTRIGLARYFAAALVLPYGEFRATAEEFRYDLQRLADHFGQGFETVCHRLSTLQRPSEPGVPFSFVRVDRAGNMSKRQSASGFHFSRGGGTCPLWNVYQAFASPGEIHVQVATMPDGARYLWVARTVHGSRRRWGAPGKTFAIALGCELRHAHRLVYSAGLDLDDPAAATPIGAGCRVCSREQCPQRAFPRLDHAPAIVEERSTFVPYPAGLGSA
ncbi:short-chain fatty acyl-CoA regulator family protein [Pseudonocardia phyllosphaerae]|uniref:short-chain fatty acyl-CoA regulator family protein n=1 Tax=Pseudonocardia phyllosphaerae TaxID=3390502 RepID=UPI00397AD404